MRDAYRGGDDKYKKLYPELGIFVERRFMSNINCEMRKEMCAVSVKIKN
jgi:hypothetical protein